MSEPRQLGTIVTGHGQITEWPKLDIPYLLSMMEKFKEDQRKADEGMLDALVDIVNRSEDKPYVWAQRIGIEFVEFVQVCHRDKPVTNDFRNKVFSYFQQLRDSQNPSNQLQHEQMIGPEVPTISDMR